MNDLKKFSSGPAFIAPVLEQHNIVVDILGQTPYDIASDGEIGVNKSSNNLGLSLTNRPPRIRFGQLTTQAYRYATAYIKFWTYSQSQWHETNEPETIIDTTWMSGFRFAGEMVTVTWLPINGYYNLLQTGIYYARFVMGDEDLPDDGSIYLSPKDYSNDEGENTTAVVGVYGGTDAPAEGDGEKIIGAFWNDALLQWDAGLEKCA